MMMARPLLLARHPAVVLARRSSNLGTSWQTSLHMHSYSSPFPPLVLHNAATERSHTWGCRWQHTWQNYWIDSDSKSPSVELPSGKKCFVFNAKRDPDGELEPVLCFVDRHGKRLLWMDGEELREFEKLISRLEEYFKLQRATQEPGSSHRPAA